MGFQYEQGTSPLAIVLVTPPAKEAGQSAALALRAPHPSIPEQHQTTLAVSTSSTYTHSSTSREASSSTNLQSHIPLLKHTEHYSPSTANLHCSGCGFQNPSAVTLAPTVSPLTMRSPNAVSTTSPVLSQPDRLSHPQRPPAFAPLPALSTLGCHA